MSTKTVKTTVTTTTTVTEEVSTPKVVETHYLFILDKSSSMSSVRDVTISGFNEQIQTLKSLEKKYENQKYYASLITFSDNVSDVLIDKSASDLQELTTKEYEPNGMTALLDAMGRGISQLEERIGNKINDPDTMVSAVVVIMTDGEENASRTWNQEKVKALVERLNKNEKWTITFIGAGQESVLAGRSYGISNLNTSSYVSSVRGTANVGKKLSQTMFARASNIDHGELSFMGGNITNDALFSAFAEKGITEDDVDPIDLNDLKNQDNKQS